MLKIEHTLCPVCSVGCGLNIISKNNEIVGINPYKNHEINEGRNCNNCTDNINDYKENKASLIDDYDDLINKSVELLKKTQNDKVTVLASGKIDNEDLEEVIKFTDKQGYNLSAYEYNFTKIDSNLIPTYDELEKATTIITIGDVYRNNSLIARRIIHAKENGCYLININKNKNLTSYNSDEYIQIDNFDEIEDKLNSQKLTEDAIIVINEIDSPENYNAVIDFVNQKNIKILPVLKYANSYSILNNIESSTINQIKSSINDSSVIMLIDEKPLEYLDEDVFSGKTIISLDSINNQISTISIPIKAWYEKDGSFTNSMGLTQAFKDTINDDTQLKTITDILNEFDNRLGD